MGLFAWTYSTLTLVVSAVAFLGLMQSEGGLIDSCYSFSFFDVSFEKCQAIGASIVKGGPVSATSLCGVRRSPDPRHFHSH